MSQKQAEGWIVALIKTFLLSLLFVSQIAGASNSYSYQVFSSNPDQFQNIVDLDNGMKIVIPRKITYPKQTNQDFFRTQASFHPAGNFPINSIEKKAWADLTKNTYLTIHKKLDNRYLPREWQEHFSNNDIQYETYMAFTNGGGGGHIGFSIEKQKALNTFQNHPEIETAFVGNAYFIPYKQNIRSLKNSWENHLYKDEISQQEIYLAVFTNGGGGGGSKKRKPFKQHKDMSEMAYLIPQQWMNIHPKELGIDNDMTDVILATRKNNYLLK